MKEFPGQAPIVPTVARCVIVCFVFLRTMPASAAPPEAYGKIKLLRDTWGVPHVFSETDAGAMYGLGYACAEERGFQMHYALRIIQGRLAEVVGARPSVARPRETAVDNDRKMRTFGFNRAAQEVAANLDSDTLELLTAYSAGVSDYVAAYRENMHPLFKVTGLQPEPWTPADCIASWWHLGQFFAGDGTCELLHYRNITSGAVEARRGGRGQAPTPSALWADDEAAVVGREDVSDEWVAKLGAFAREHGA